jgi:hypothetical protein
VRDRDPTLTAVTDDRLTGAVARRPAPRPRACEAGAAEQDVEVDGGWLEFAVSAGRLEGRTSDYAWVSPPDVLAAELKGTHSRIQAVDVEKRVRYRILGGSFSRANVLMKKTGPRKSPAGQGGAVSRAESPIP